MSSPDLDAAWAAIGNADVEPGMVKLSELPVENNVGRLVVGRDSHQRLHLLVPVPLGSAVPTDRRSRGVALERNEYVIGADRRLFFDVVCHDPELDDTFRQLAGEMVARIAADPDASVTSCQTVLAHWRELLERRLPPLSGEALAGLFGELHTLHRIVSRDPARRIAVWVGPTGATHDFRTDTTELEVKTTTKREGRFAEVHGVEQLVATGDRDLYLSFVRLRADATGQSVTDLIASLESSGADGIRLRELTAMVGWKEPADESRFVVAEERIYRVDGQFPKIVPSSFVGGETPGGVMRLRYEVDLTGPVPAFLGDAAVDGLFEELALG